MLKHYEAVYRAKKGKTIRVCVDIEGALIKKVVFTGDFFMEPGDEIDNLMKLIKDVKIDDKEIYRKIRLFFKNKGISLFGATPEDFENALKEAIAQIDTAIK